MKNWTIFTKMYEYYFTFKYKSFWRNDETKFSNKTPFIFFFHGSAMLLCNTFWWMFCRYTDFLFKISTIPLKAFCRIGFIEMLIRYCYSIVLNELCGCKYKCCNTIHDSRPVISEYLKALNWNFSILLLEPIWLYKLYLNNLKLGKNNDFMIINQKMATPLKKTPPKPQTCDRCNKCYIKLYKYVWRCGVLQWDGYSEIQISFPLHLFCNACRIFRSLQFVLKILTWRWKIPSGRI